MKKTAAIPAAAKRKSKTSAAAKAKATKPARKLLFSEDISSDNPFDDLMAMVSQLQGSKFDDDLDRAQDIAFDAMEAATPKRRASLARKALAISPLCSDAYVVLAQDAPSPEAALDLYRQAVDTARKALGEETFTEDAGHFWGLIETRPFMRASHHLAIELWRAGEREAAVGVYREMLHLNPGDNQGVRYTLLDHLIALGHEVEAAALIKRYKNDDAAYWTWSAALLTFRQKGDGAMARKALMKAQASNPYVLAYLDGRRPLPRALPEYIGFGDENEAAAYATQARSTWQSVPGALAWAAAVLGEKPAVPNVPGPPVITLPEPDNGLIDEAVLALLMLGHHDGFYAWKGHDWDALDRLHHKGLIDNPRNKTKSVAFTHDGLAAAEAAFRKLLAASEKS